MKRLLLAGIALFATALAVGWLPAGPRAASAATADVDVSDNVFTPGTLTINAGDTVHWMWSGSNPHSVVSTGSESFSSSIQTTGTFDHTFNTAGTFTYQCGVHGAAMPGTIIVQAATAPTSTATAASGNTPSAATNTPPAGATPVPADTATRAATAGTVTPSGSPAAAVSTPTRTGSSPTLPATGTGGGGDSGATWLLAALALLGTAFVGAAGVAIRRRR